METSESPTRFASFQDFWPFYVCEHSQPMTRLLHFAGTALLLPVALLGFMVSAWYFLALPVVGYGFAWLSHAFVEKNKPATFSYPLWSLLADFKMFFFTLTGRMASEVERCTAEPRQG